ncbi:type II secretion system protein [Peribacillus sp. NPDC097675]|uniref:type II secretion system protein n=1 Tax=Peribacillus sp. NPDC097675 TaxID=3390618 RepID=UPI003D017E70
MEGNIFLKKQRGFTLVEVLASIAILGVITITAMAFFTQSYDYTKRNQSKTVGINVARNVINYFDQLEFNELYKQYEIASLESEEGIKITLADCNTRPSLHKTSCSEILQPTINNYKYDTEIILKKYNPNEAVSDTGYDLNKNLIGIEVKVVWEDKETRVEGLLKK